LRRAEDLRSMTIRAGGSCCCGLFAITVMISSRTAAAFAAVSPTPCIRACVPVGIAKRSCLNRVATSARSRLTRSSASANTTSNGWRWASCKSVWSPAAKSCWRRIFPHPCADDRPLLVLGLLPADAQLVFDRRIALIVGAIAGIQANAGHRKHPLHPYAISGAPRCSRSVEPVRETWP
jgi:hypothetical protein